MVSCYWPEHCLLVKDGFILLTSTLSAGKYCHLFRVERSGAVNVILHFQQQLWFYRKTIGPFHLRSKYLMTSVLRHRERSPEAGKNHKRCFRPQRSWGGGRFGRWKAPRFFFQSSRCPQLPGNGLHYRWGQVVEFVGSYYIGGAHWVIGGVIFLFRY